MKLPAILATVAIAAALDASAQQPIEVRLWDNASAPHSNGITRAEESDDSQRIGYTTETVLYIYRPAEGTATGQAVVVCPGGGYWIAAMGHEGHDVGRWFARHGITAAILKYRMPNGHPEVPIEDALEAVRYMREEYAHGGRHGRWASWASRPGGHLAASTGVGALPNTAARRLIPVPTSCCSSTP